MVKHLKTFSSITAFAAFLGEAEDALIGRVDENDNIYYNMLASEDDENAVILYDNSLNACVRVPEQEYNTRYAFSKNVEKCNFLTFSGNGTVMLQRNGGSNSNLPDLQLEYSIDGGVTWASYTIGTSIELSDGKSEGNGAYSVMFKGNNQKISWDTSYYHYFVMTGEIYASGDVTSLNNIKGGNYALTNSYSYYNLFYGCTSLITAPALPSTTLRSYCYYRMFSGCTSLETAPELPATTLASSCYSSMFYGCTSLVTAPELPATTLAQYCYNYMFYGCTNLNYIKAMFTTTPSTSYTSNWVYGVSSSGTFVKNSKATWNVTGVHGVPTGWTVETAAA